MRNTQLKLAEGNQLTFLGGQTLIMITHRNITENKTVSFMKRNQLILLREITGIYCENHRKKYRVGGRMLSFLAITKVCIAYRCHWFIPCED
jgi:hypothetical protein